MNDDFPVWWLLLIAGSGVVLYLALMWVLV